uniref:NAD(P)-dependent oxidoreductase n=1 Tax=Marinobacterium profundum TaxID=1714300 RepID=UPI00082F7B0F|nr:NAD(P)-dependent oxidoreductase [Marinobacterium profundum]
MGNEETAVGIIGLGIMGSAVAHNLLEQGFKVYGCDRNQSRREQLSAKGGVAVTAPKDIPADTIICLLPTSAALENVVSGKGGLTERPRPGQVIIECSTLPLCDKQRACEALATIEVTMLDCPLSGTGAQAVNRDLLVLASGSHEAYESRLGVLQGFANRQRYLGDFGKGTSMKMITNLLVQIHNVAAAEAMVLGHKAGLDAAMLYEVLCDSAGTSRMLEVRGPMMVDRKYDPPAMKIEVFKKDMDLIGAFASELACPTPLFSTSTQLYFAALSQGHGGQDTAAVHEVLWDLAMTKDTTV